MKQEGKIRNFYNLRAWQEGYKLVLEIYKITQSFPKEELFGIVSQLRRVASSIIANIAEGFARYHYKDKVRFYYQARGSVAEVQNFLILARGLGYIDVKICGELGEKANQVRQLINGLIRSITKQRE